MAASLQLTLERAERELAAAAQLIAEQAETIRQLERHLVPPAGIPMNWRLTLTEERLLRALLGVDLLTRDAAMDALYGHRPDDPPGQKVLNVLICDLRRKTRPFGVAIGTEYGRGWRLRDRQAWRERLGVAA